MIATSRRRRLMLQWGAVVPSSAGESGCRARTTRGVLVTRDRDAPAAAADAAVLRCHPPARLGRTTAERGRHAACSSRAIATRPRQQAMLSSGAVIRQLSWGERLQIAEGVWRSDALLVSRDRDMPAAAADAALWPCPLGRLPAERRWHVACSSGATATRLRSQTVHPCSTALCQHSWGGSLQSVDSAWRDRLARSRRAGGGIGCCRAALHSDSVAGEGASRAQTTCGVLV
jgi:hypothetical protein